MTDTVWTLSVFCKAAPQFLLPHITHLSYYLATTPSQPKGPHEPRVRIKLVVHNDLTHPCMMMIPSVFDHFRVLTLY
jgi:hypothetical protein